MKKVFRICLSLMLIFTIGTLYHQRNEAFHIADEALNEAEEAVNYAKETQKENKILREKLLEIDQTSSYIQRYNPTLNPTLRDQIAAELINASYKYNLPLDLLLNAARVESRFDVTAKGTKGERGLLQVMPGTFQGLRPRGNHQDWRQTLDAGAEYLSWCLKKAGGNEKLAIAYYNAGPGHKPERAMQLASRHVSRVFRHEGR